MANALYSPTKAAWLASTAGYNLDQNTATDGPFLALTTAGYTFSAAHATYSQVTPASNVVGTDMRLTSPAVTNGAFSGSNLTFSAVTGSAVTQLILYRHNSGANTTWPLVAKIDTVSSGLPVTPNGGNITVTWDASGVFTL